MSTTRRRLGRLCDQLGGNSASHTAATVASPRFPPSSAAAPTGPGVAPTQDADLAFEQFQQHGFVSWCRHCRGRVGQHVVESLHVSLGGWVGEDSAQRAVGGGGQGSTELTYTCCNWDSQCILDGVIPDLYIPALRAAAEIAVGETVILLHPPLHPC